MKSRAKNNLAEYLYHGLVLCAHSLGFKCQLFSKNRVVFSLVNSLNRVKVI